MANQVQRHSNNMSFQHLSSLKHLESVQAAARGPTSQGSAPSSSTLLERFLQDVLQHHPHHYQDPR